MQKPKVREPLLLSVGEHQHPGGAAPKSLNGLSSASSSAVMPSSGSPARVLGGNCKQGVAGRATHSAGQMHCRSTVS